MLSNFGVHESGSTHYSFFIKKVSSFSKIEIPQKFLSFLSRKVLTLAIIMFINVISHLFTVEKKGVI